MSADPVPAGDPELRRLLGQLFDPNIRFPERPVFVADLDIFEMPDGLGFQIRGLEAPVVLRGQGVGAVVQHLRACLDGRMTRERLVGTPPPGVASAAFARALLLLHSKGVLVAADPAPAEPAAPDATLARQMLFWGRQLGITRAAGSAREVQHRLAAARLVVVGTGLFGAVTCDLLARSGIGTLLVLAWNDDGPMQGAAEQAVAPPARFHRLPTTELDPALLLLREWLAGADLLVTATCDAPGALFEGINALSLQVGTPWLCGNADGSAFDIGPLVQPFESGCYTCLDLRRRSARELAFESEFYEERLAGERDAAERVLRGEAIWPATLAASLLAGEACRLVTGLAPPTLSETVLRLQPVTGALEQGRFARVPRCPACYRGAIAAVDLVS